jgi:hypothetical protein
MVTPTLIRNPMIVVFGRYGTQATLAIPMIFLLYIMILGYVIFCHMYIKRHLQARHMSFRGCINTWFQESTLEWINPHRTLDLPTYLITYLSRYIPTYLSTYLPTCLP